MDLHRPFVLFTLLAALGLGSCESEDSPTLPQVVRSSIEVSVIPTPVEAVQNAANGAVNASFRVNIQEVNGLGCEVVFVSSSVFDPETGLQVTPPNYYDSADLVVFVGSKRIEPLSALVVSQTVSYSLPDARKQANLAVLVQVKDDRGNTTNGSVMVKIE